MKKKLFICFTFILTCNILLAQEKRFSGHGSQIQLEIPGPAGVFSVRFESRFMKRPNGMGYTVGFGAAPYNLEESCNDGGFLTIPLGLNYLLGKEDHMLEIGAGAVLKILGGGTKVWCPELEDNFIENGNPAYFYGLVGYRYQPISKRLTWRIFVSPLFQKGFSPKFWGGASVGLKFGRAK